MISRVSRLLVLSALFSSMAFAGSQAHAQHKPTGAALAEVLAKFDAVAESSRVRFGVPGMAIAVIQGKSVIFSKGYGARVQGEPAAVDTSYSLYDLYHARPARDHTGAFLADAQARAEADKFPLPPARPAPARDPNAYAGTYVSPYFGLLAADVRDGSLLMTLGARKTPVRLKHGDTFAFALPGDGAPMYTDGFVTCVFGEAGQALELRFIRGFDDADNGRFTRR